MKRVIRVVEAVPWRGICRFSFKVLSLFAFAVATVILFIVRSIGYADRNEAWTSESPGDSITRPDQPLYGPHNN
jgi:hypothetical protein